MAHDPDRYGLKNDDVAVRSEDAKASDATGGHGKDSQGGGLVPTPVAS